ncbi:MAG: FecCD family ABC transporter permease [Desulfobacterales bacterium]
MNSHLPEDSPSFRAASETDKDRKPIRIPIGFQVPALAAALAAAIVVSAALGYVRMPASDVARIIFSGVFNRPDLVEHMDPVAPVVVLDVRLPRILTASLVGGSLAAAGAVFQGILLNPLADPYTLGVSAGAAFGASVAILLNLKFAGVVSVPIFAFAGAAATLFFVIYLASGSGGMSSTHLVLSGIIVAAILSAALSFLKYVADEEVGVIIFWLMGSFASRTWGDALLVLGALAIGMSIFMICGRDLNLMALGDRSAASMGVDTRKITIILLVTASLVTAVCVAVSGIIGFVGLLIPHLVRMATGPDNRRLLPVAMLTGALMLLAADTTTRALLPQEIPIGVLTALIGGPFFCYVFRRHQLGRK